MKRLLLFTATNIAVLVVLTAVLRVFGVEDYLHQLGYRGNLGTLLVFCAAFGMIGSFISLLLSKPMAMRAVGAHVIREPKGPAEEWLVETVRRQAQASGIGMPDVAVYPDETPNAFATGARKDSALVAVSTGLVQRMKPDEVEAVLGHEVSHVANGDMVTLTLLQGVLNTFVMFAARVVGGVIDAALPRSQDEEHRGPGIGYLFTVIVLEILFGVLASMIVMWFSRQREFRADAGGARLAGRGSMIGALQRLATASGQPLPGQLQAFGIQAGQISGWRRLFMSHPPIAERIARLQSA
jgi:heat shock protein HtpX